MITEATSFLNCAAIEREVGDTQHREYWIPAGDLHELNENIVGEIVVLAKFPA